MNLLDKGNEKSDSNGTWHANNIDKTFFNPAQARRSSIGVHCPLKRISKYRLIILRESLFVHPSFEKINRFFYTAIYHVEFRLNSLIKTKCEQKGLSEKY